MIEDRVPILISSWSGTGTVTVLPATRFCMTTWLPRLRTSTKPCSCKMAQTSAPESLRSLPKRDLDLRHVDFPVKPVSDLLLGRRLEEQL